MLLKYQTLARKYVGTEGDSFVKYATCSTCQKIYTIDDCIEKLPNGKFVSKKCDHIEFPHHPMTRYRKPCGTVLMKNVRYSNGTEHLCPRNVFCYQSLIESFQNFLKRPNFIENCQKWRHRQQVNEVYSDVYDGDLWKEFQTYDGVPFLSLPHNFAFILNIDWYQPYRHTQYSLGAIYLAILNLPRDIRYRRENILLVGIIPGPNEPKKHVNSFTRPLTMELQRLWHGVMMQNCDNTSIIVRAALLCVSCDIPAGRKLSGFVGPSALQGCSRCLLKFPTEQFGEKPDYSNFERAQWPPRLLNLHRQMVAKYLACTTSSDRNKHERETGVRYSVLNDLPYFDAPRMTVIDPMHNLLLGSAKYILGIWKDQKILDNDKFVRIQAMVDSFISPGDIGRIPLKIASGFADFTAEQWIIYYSLVALKPLLPFHLYNLWHTFVKACYLLCRRVISSENLMEADQLLIDYCKRYVDIYGKDYCTPNLHLHGHLASCVKDYGPVYAFWLFPFERLNGVLGSYHNNNNSISVQVMRHFTKKQLYGLENWPLEFRDDFGKLLHGAEYCKGSLMFSTLEGCLQSSNVSDLVEAIPPMTEYILTSPLKNGLLLDLRQYYNGGCDVSSICSRCKAIRIGNFVLGTKKSKFTTSSRLLVSSDNDDKLVEVLYYLKCNVVFSEKSAVLWVHIIVNTHARNGLEIQFKYGLPQPKLIYISFHYHC